MLATTINDIARATNTRIRPIGDGYLFIQDSQFSWALPVAALEQRTGLILGADGADHAYVELCAVPATIGTHLGNETWLTIPEDARRAIVEEQLLGDELCAYIEGNLRLPRVGDGPNGPYVEYDEETADEAERNYRADWASQVTTTTGLYRAPLMLDWLPDEG